MFVCAVWRVCGTDNSQHTSPHIPTIPGRRRTVKPNVCMCAITDDLFIFIVQIYTFHFLSFSACSVTSICSSFQAKLILDCLSVKNLTHSTISTASLRFYEWYVSRHRKNVSNMWCVCQSVCFSHGQIRENPSQVKA